MRIIYCLLALALVELPVSAMEEPHIPGMETEQLIVQNRIVAKVNGKTISILDVMKKMDLFLIHNYPHLADSKLARYQYYSSNWRQTLAQMIDTELILADAEGKEIKVSDGDIREKMQDNFGPNIMASLDKLGIAYEEARKIIEQEIIVQRMSWFKVNSKAMQKVNPQDIKNAYHDFCVKNPPMEEWTYQVISIRSSDMKKSSEIAFAAYDLLVNDHIALASLKDTLKTKANSLDTSIALASLSEPQAEVADPIDDVSISLSEEYKVNEKTISKSHKEVLSTLRPLSYSQPISQINRVDKSEVFRIFYLKNHRKTITLPFEKLSIKLENQLLEEAVNIESTLYINKLRERFGYDEKHMQETLPNDFQPFFLH